MLAASIFLMISYYNSIFIGSNSQDNNNHTKYLLESGLRVSICGTIGGKAAISRGRSWVTSSFNKGRSCLPGSAEAKRMSLVRVSGLKALALTSDWIPLPLGVFVQGTLGRLDNCGFPTIGPLFHHYSKSL